MRRLPGWLVAPNFNDMEKTRKAALLHVILLFSLVALVINGLVALVTLPGYGYIYALQNAIVGAVLAVFYWLNQRGQVEHSIRLTTFAIWLLMVLGIFAFKGIYDPYSTSFVFVIMMASLLINTKVSFIYTAMTIITGFVWIAAQPPPYMEAITIWMADCFIFVLVAFLMWLAERGIQRGVMQLQTQERQLQLKNEALAREIAERIQAEKDLQHREIQSRQLLEVTPIAVAVIDEAASLLYLNPSGVQLANVGAEAPFIGLSLYTVIPDLESRSLEHPTPTQHTVTIGAEQRDIELRSVPFDFQQQQAYLLLITDITAQRRIEQDRMDAETLRIQMEEERKLLKLRDSFAAMVSHEFRTPLTVIQSSRDVLAKHHHRLSDEKREQVLSRINQQVERMTELLDDILVFSQFDAGIKRSKLEAFHLEDFWQNLIDEVTLVYPEYHFQTAFESADAPNAWDKGLLRHVLFNLMTNAAKYSPSGSVIQCSLHYTANDAVLTVQDNGRGIPEADQARLFEPFMRAGNTGTVAGTGLGLTIVKQSVDAQGGTIHVESAENAGTTFTIRLPLVRVDDQLPIYRETSN